MVNDYPNGSKVHMPAAPPLLASSDCHFTPSSDAEMPHGTPISCRGRCQSNHIPTPET